MDRKSNIRTQAPSLDGGTQTVMGGKQSEAKKDSLTGSNTVKEYIPGSLKKGAGSDGGKGQRN